MIKKALEFNYILQAISHAALPLTIIISLMLLDTLPLML